MLRQVQGHLDAVRAVRGWRPAPRTTQALAQAGHEREASRLEVLHERTRELYAAAAENQQRRLSQGLRTQLICCRPARSRLIALWRRSSTPRDGTGMGQDRGLGGACRGAASPGRPRQGGA
jgi:hypothetical protein